MKKVLLLFIILCAFGCTSCGTKPNYLANLDDKSVDKIQVITSMGNPLYGADSKIITNKDEIINVVNTFNQGKIGDKIPKEEVLVGFSSCYRFYNQDNLIAEYRFNINNTKIAVLEDGYYFVDYGEKAHSPYKLYTISTSPQIVVDMEGKEMDLIRYQGKTYVKSALSTETVAWLEWYHTLSEDEKATIVETPDFGMVKPLGKE